MALLFRGLFKPAGPLTSSIRSISVGGDKLIALNDLHNVPGAKRKRRRWGRGTGSGRGKLCGFGHQKSFSTPRAFEGGQTPLYKRLPKIGFTNPNAREFNWVSTQKIQEFIDMGRLTPKQNEMITIRDLFNVGLISHPADGIKLLKKHPNDKLTHAIHLEVSAASEGAIKVVEEAGGTVTCCHFTPLSLRALIKPFKFQLYPRRARPPPRLIGYYLDHSKRGYLSPEVQLRNLSLFGSVTSEERYRKQHDAYMQEHRDAVKLKNKQLEEQAREAINANPKKYGWLGKMLESGPPKEGQGPPRARHSYQQ